MSLRALAFGASALLMLLWFLFGRDSSKPVGLASGEGVQAASEVSGRPPAPEVEVGARLPLDGTGDQRSQAAPPEGGDPPRATSEALPRAALVAAAREYAARAQARQKAAAPGDSLGSLEAVAADRDSELQARYSGWTTQRLDEARDLFQALIDWQTHGPFETEDERLPKDVLEELEAELRWLREVAGT